MIVSRVDAKALARKGSAVIGPAVFSLAGGHLRSAVLSRSVDALGNPIPWYTYPAVDFLEHLDLSPFSVVEFGSGQSTLWWARHAREVMSLESDAAWYEKVRASTASVPSVDLKLVGSPEEAATQVKPGGYDIAVVDGGLGHGHEGRRRNADTAFRTVRPTGLIIVDNANAAYNEPVIDLAKELGWLRIDFVGHAAGSIKRSCTSFFFRPEVEVLSNPRKPTLSQIRRAS